MSFLLKTGLALKGRWIGRRFENACADPQGTQAAYLKGILSREAGTRFGSDHGFANIHDATGYRKRVPARDYEALRPWFDLAVQDYERVLTTEPVLMYATTSGTSDKPKLIPVTATWLKELSALITLWLYRAQIDHPGTFAAGSLSLVSPAIEGHTSRGTPIGSVSGLTYRRIPWIVRRSYAIPYSVSEIANYDDRYFVAARIMFASDVSMLAAPNPSTFLRLAKEGRVHAERMIRAIHDGALGVIENERGAERDARQSRIYEEIESGCSPDPARAAELERCLETHGEIAPRMIWPRLSLIGTWLGGSAGVQARRLLGPYGETPLRDLGFRATEATMTVPMQDGDPSGPLALNSGFYEFIPEEDIEQTHPRVLLAHEIERGCRYYILLTTSNGLYRYDINDVVEVTGFHGRCPCVAFVRKGRDMSSITGEKLHSRQVGAAAEAASVELGVTSLHMQIIPDPDAMRYDLLMESREDDPELSERFAKVFDDKLAALNLEYETKRKSRRLGPPRLRRMKPGWAQRQRRREVEHGQKRDAQYKWPLIAPQWDEEARRDCCDDPEE